MKMSKLGCFSEFLLFPPLVLIAILLAFRSSVPPQPVIWTIVFSAGLATWTLIEYWLHRALFHHAPILSRIHKRHHHSPQDLIGTPAWASLLIALIAVAIPSWAALGFGLGTAATAGLVNRLLRVRLRPLRDPPLAATPGFLSLSGAAAACAPPPFIQ
jgi:sterol desaturase/sphingolipid hydroxylase (fatty acid hydroxylase superfamily)